MANFFKVAAEKRETTGTSSTRKLREAGKLPAVIYGKHKDNHIIALDSKEITKRVLQGNFYTQPCEIKFGDQTINAIPKELTFHPVTDVITHVDFYQLDDKEKVRIKAHIKLLHVNSCAGVKKGGVINIATRAVELLCFPKNIISELEIDMIDLHIGESVHVSDLKLPEGVELAITSYNPTIATIVGRMAEEVEEEPTVVGEEGDEEEDDDDAEEGEENAEGSSEEGGDGDKKKDEGNKE